jgi:hypothetical protein
MMSREGMTRKDTFKTGFAAVPTLPSTEFTLAGPVEAASSMSCVRAAAPFEWTKTPKANDRPRCAAPSAD